MVGFNITISGNTYSVDMFEDSDFKLNLSFAEIQDITKRNSTYSKSFYVPGSKHNNDVFQHFFNINASFTDYDVRKKMDAVLTYDGYEIMEGYLRLEFVNIENTDVIYNLTFYSDFGNLLAGIGDKLMYDLDLSDLDHPYNSPQIALASLYDPDIYIPTGSTYAYQDGRAFWFLGHFGYDYTTGDTLNFSSTPILAFNLTPGFLPAFDNPNFPLRSYYHKPSVSFKTLYEYIFNQAGFEIESDFFNTAYFKRYFLPLTFNENLYLKQGVELEYYSLVENVGGIDFQNINWTSTDGSYSGLAERHRLKPNNTNNFSAHTLSDYYFEVPSDGNYDWKFSFNGFNSELFPESIDLSSRSSFYLHKFPLSATTSGETIYTTNFFVVEPGGGLSSTYKISGYFETGYGYALDLRQEGVGTFIVTRLQLELLNAPPTLVGDFKYNLEFPEDKFKQIEFIQAVNNLFGLVIVPSTEKSKTLIVEPMIDFIGTGEVLDWTMKIDRNQPIQISPTTNLINGSMEFSIEQDTDNGNEQFFNTNNRVFGTEIINLNTDFPDNTIEFGSVFGSSVDFVMGNLQNSYATLPIFYVLETEESDGNVLQFFRPFRTLPRPLFRGSTITGANLNTSNISATTIYESWYLESNEIDVFQVNNRFTTYPFGVSGFSHYTNFNNTDFYDITELQFTEAEDMYDVYYKDYVEDLIDPDSRILDCYVYLTREEIKNITFKEKIVIDNNYYRINKIENYDITKDQPVLCQLVKLTRDYTPHRKKCYKLTNCGGGIDLYTNTDLNYTMYQYVGNYISISGSCYSITEVDCGDYNYQRVEIPYSASTTYIPLVYTDCNCNTQIELLDIYDDYNPQPIPSPTPTPSITPSITPTITPSATPGFIPGCDEYTIENENPYSVQYSYTDCCSGQFTTGTLGAYQVDIICSLTAPQGSIYWYLNGACGTPCPSPTPTPTYTRTPTPTPSTPSVFKYEVEDCDFPGSTLIVSHTSALNFGDVVRLSLNPGCYSVIGSSIGTAIDSVIGTPYADCETCPR